MDKPQRKAKAQNGTHYFLSLISSFQGSKPNSEPSRIWPINSTCPSSVALDSASVLRNPALFQSPPHSSRSFSLSVYLPKKNHPETCWSSVIDLDEVYSVDRRFLFLFLILDLFLSVETFPGKFFGWETIAFFLFSRLPVHVNGCIEWFLLWCSVPREFNLYAKYVSSLSPVKFRWKGAIGNRTA